MSAVQRAIVLLGGWFACAAHAQPAAPEPFPLPPKDWPSPVMDTMTHVFFLLDRLEIVRRAGDDGRLWDAQGWLGGDVHKLWWKSEGEAVPGGRTESGNVELLYSRLVSPYWHLQAGLREDFRPRPSRTALALGVQGLAPQWFEVEATAYVSEQGKLSARFEAEYDVLLTQRLILQPRFETSLSARDRERGVGSGINEIELGLRLRYEVRRRIAPYVGVTWSRKIGATADLAREAEERVTQRGVVAGLRLWF